MKTHADNGWCVYAAIREHIRTGHHGDVTPGTKRRSSSMGASEQRAGRGGGGASSASALPRPSGVEAPRTQERPRKHPEPALHLQQQAPLSPTRRPRGFHNAYPAEMGAGVGRACTAEVVREATCRGQGKIPPAGPEATASTDGGGRGFDRGRLDAVRGRWRAGVGHVGQRRGSATARGLRQWRRPAAVTWGRGGGDEIRGARTPTAACAAP